MHNETADIVSGILSGFSSEKNQRVSVPVSELKANMLENAKAAGMEATGEHLFALASVFRDHRNIFITGDAGTGKTWFVKYLLLEELNNRGLNFVVTATTGIAGSHLEGKTLHSWAGIGLGPYFQPTQCPVEMHPDDVEAIFKETIDTWETGPKLFPKAREGIRNRIRSCEVLLVDEVSMCAGTAFLDFVDRFLRHVRQKDEPFGGIQMIFIGDFLQLPPVEKRPGRHPDWAFLSRSWREGKVLPVEFTKVFRQTDQDFARFLNRRRLGIPVEGEEHEYVKQFLRQMTKEEALQASYLVPTNEKADDINNNILAVYPAPTTVLLARDTIQKHHVDKYNPPEKIREKIIKSKVVKDKLQLRIGLPVMITINHPDGEYVNGTKGYVHGFITPPGAKEVEQVQVRIELNKREYEMRLAVWEDTPLTIRGLRPTREVVIAFSRKRYTQLANEDPEETMEQTEDIEVDGKLQSITKQVPRYPYISQFPLIPASAITIHKSQGMSLDECVIDLRQSFAPGHVYVALSRLRSAAGLTLMSPRLEMKSDPFAIRFYEALRGFRSQNTIPL